MPSFRATATRAAQAPKLDGKLHGLKNLYIRTNLGQLDVLGEVPEVCTFEEVKRRGWPDRRAASVSPECPAPEGVTINA